MRIDHIVWYQADLAEGSRFFAERMDIPPLYGGEHPGEGTANSVMALGPTTYLEILGRDPAQSNVQLESEVKALSGSGIYHWAIGGIDLQTLRDRAERAGLSGGGLVPGGRVRPDGKRLSWTCWGLRNHQFGSLLPFFIDWMDSEHPAVSAPLGGRLKTFHVESDNAAALEKVFTALDLDIAVKSAPAAAVVAHLESHRGVLELRSFKPLPRGYVI